MKRMIIILLLYSFYSNSLNAQVTYNFPESAVYDNQNNRYLISNTGNGNIIARDMNGNLSYFNQGGSTSIRGITISNNKLFAAGDEGILVYDLTTGQKTNTYAIAGAIFPNDITADASGNIYVSDNQAHKIFKWTASNQQTTTFVTMDTTDEPNGIYCDQVNNRLIVVFWSVNSPIEAVDLTSGAITSIITTNLSYLDGITRDNTGNFYISSSGTNAVYKYDPNFIIEPILVSSGYNGPADIFYDNTNNVLVIPNMGANTVEFRLMPYINIVRPNGGEIWRIGSTQTIQWASRDVTDVKLIYSTDNGYNWITIISSIDASIGSYQWLIPDPPSASCIVIILDKSDPTIKDQSDFLFGIELQPVVTVVKPDGGEVWDIGSSQVIQWTSTNVSDVTIEYSTNNGTNWIEIVNKTNASVGTYQWTIPNTPSTNCLVKIFNFNEAAIKDQSDNVFKIQVPVSVEDESIDHNFYLAQNYPNPFNPSTTISYTIPTPPPAPPLSKGRDMGGVVTLKVYDILGREVATLVNEYQLPGKYNVEFRIENSELSCGVYLYRLITGNFSSARKMIFMK